MAIMTYMEVKSNLADTGRAAKDNKLSPCYFATMGALSSNERPPELYKIIRILPSLVEH
jgi:hypothetical protein